MLLLTTSVLAHDMYFISRPLILKKPEKVSLVMFLQREEIVWFGSQTIQLHLFGPQSEKSLTIPDEGDPIVQLENEGTYVVGWQSKPGFVKVDPPIFNQYIVLEGYTDVIRSRRENAKEKEAGREIYSRFLKTFIQVGDPRTDDFNRSLGFKIEIMPLTNPYLLREGSDFDVRLIYDGAPLANHKIMATYEGYSIVPEEYAEVTRTDESGIARFHLSHKGIWMVRTNQMLPLHGNPDADWESFWANCTFQVQ
jgi:hypothetical protein